MIIKSEIRPSRKANILLNIGIATPYILMLLVAANIDFEAAKNVPAKAWALLAIAAAMCHIPMLILFFEKFKKVRIPEIDIAAEELKLIAAEPPMPKNLYNLYNQGR